MFLLSQVLKLKMLYNQRIMYDNVIISDLVPPYTDYFHCTELLSFDCFLSFFCLHLHQRLFEISLKMASSSIVLNDKICIICKVPFIDSIDKDVAEVSSGMDRLLEYSEKYNDSELYQYLLSKPAVVKVHNKCRRDFTNKRRYEQKCAKDLADSGSVTNRKLLRSSAQLFDWKIHCFLCRETCVVDKVHPNSKSVRRVETLEFRSRILEHCDFRCDEWALDIKGRLSACNDLVAEEAVYHKECHRNFFRVSTHSSRGRPIDKSKNETFDKLCEWLEVNDSELLSLQDVVGKARVLVKGNEAVYNEQRLKQKLIARYGDHIQFNEVRGRRNVICWKDMAAYIVNQKWYDDSKGERGEHLIVAAAKLLKSTIREATHKMECYPTCSDVSNPARAREWMPSLLCLFLDNLICPESKKISIGHTIVQAVKPRTVIAPIPFALGVSVDHITGSKFLINVLNKLGMSVSYDEVYRFKQSVARNISIDQPASFPNCFTQFAADNVDHDVCTLDGLGTLHAMGIISITNSCQQGRRTDGVPASDDSEAIPVCESDVSVTAELRSDEITPVLASECHTQRTELPVERLKRMKSCDVAKLQKIPVLHCSLPADSMANVTFQSPSENSGANHSLQFGLSTANNLDLLFHISWFLRDGKLLRPSWAGFNNCILRGAPVHASDIRMHPIIDVNPNDLSCIYSTLVHIMKEAEKLAVTTPTVTFDQPLWLKAFNIANFHKLNVVCRLGAFHVQMSFLGSIGSVMAGSGLCEMIQCCYGPNATKHIMSGKAVARSVRAHFLIESALTITLLSSIVNSEDFAVPITQMQSFYDQLASSGYDPKNSVFPDCVEIYQKALAEMKVQLCDKSRTAKLWINYLRYVGILKMLLRAERTADWQLHLHSIRSMLNLFAATGHNNYAKCARLYVEMMDKLSESHPDLYVQFMAGGHVARRSNKLWAGLPTDLTIEQAMMAAVKGRGGLTHGRGVSESVRSLWIGSVHKTAAVKTALAQLTNTDYCHDQIVHVEQGKARVKRDNADLCKMLDFIEIHDPFSTVDCRLRSLTSGIVAADSDNIDCDDAEAVGCRIMRKIDGAKFTDVSFKRSEQVKTLALVTNVVTVSKKKHFNIDPTVLFNRLLVIMQRNPENNLEQYFAYELAAKPTSLFRDSFMRKTDKSQLATEICKGIENCAVPPFAVHVVDGGYLLHIVHWTTGSIYAEVIQQYVRFVTSRYGTTAIVVFDGYCNGPSTKDHEHQRRAKKVAPDIALDMLKASYKDQSAFLSNDNNKAAFVALLMTHLELAGHTVYQAKDDADTLVAEVGLKLASQKQVVAVVANDTDILILLLFHFRPAHMSDIVMLSQQSQRTTSIRTVAGALGPLIVSRLLVIHAFSGCDTVSGLFGHG